MVNHDVSFSQISIDRNIEVDLPEGISKEGLRCSLKNYGRVQNYICSKNCIAVSWCTRHRALERAAECNMTGKDIKQIKRSI